MQEHQEFNFEQNRTEEIAQRMRGLADRIDDEIWYAIAQLPAHRQLEYKKLATIDQIKLVARYFAEAIVECTNILDLQQINLRVGVVEERAFIPVYVEAFDTENVYDLKINLRHLNIIEEIYLSPNYPVHAQAYIAMLVAHELYHIFRDINSPESMAKYTDQLSSANPLQEILLMFLHLEESNSNFFAAAYLKYKAAISDESNKAEKQAFLQMAAQIELTAYSQIVLEKVGEIFYKKYSSVRRYFLAKE